MRSKLTINHLLLYTLAFAIIFAVSIGFVLHFIPVFILVGTLVGRLIADLSTSSRFLRWLTILSCAWFATVFVCLWDLGFQVPVELSVWVQAAPALLGYGVLAALIVQSFFFLCDCLLKLPKRLRAKNP